MIILQSFENKQDMLDFVGENPKSNTLYYGGGNVIFRTNNVDGEDTVYNFITPTKGLKFTAIADDTTINYEKSYSATVSLSISNDGQTFTEWDGSDVEIDNGSSVYVMGNNPTGFGVNKYITIGGTGKFKCDGSVMWLFGEGIDEIEGGVYLSNLFNNCTALTTAPELSATSVESYYQMFKGCTALTTAPELPATSVGENGYNSMFLGCTALTTAPELPATSVGVNGYGSMFAGCTALTTAPELSATTLLSHAYYQMFKGCTSLTTAPTSLPCTQLPTITNDIGVYESMFEGCTSLTTAPELPATNINKRCYVSMFKGCTSLTTAPELSAATLSLQSSGNAFFTMFEGCINLKNVKCLTNYPTGAQILIYKDWLKDVSATGTFTKKSGVTWATGTSGIPTGWTVVEVD